MSAMYFDRWRQQAEETDESRLIRCAPVSAVSPVNRPVNRVTTKAPPKMWAWNVYDPLDRLAARGVVPEMWSSANRTGSLTARPHLVYCLAGARVVSGGTSDRR